MPIENPKTDGNEHLMKDAFPEDELETSGVRFAKVMGQEFRLEAIDPYALWRVVPKKGKLPQELSGAYTSPSEAESAIKAYLTAERFKEELKRNGTPTNTQSEPISDKSGTQPTQHVRKGLDHRSN